jgi:nicotinamide-nucleotide amidase
MVDHQAEQDSSSLSSSVFQSVEGSRIEVLITGDELLEGHWSDEHAQTIAKAVRSLGGSISRFNIVGDHLEELKQTLSEIVQRAHVCLITGGLGPTLDDLTIDVLAEVADVKAPIVEETWSEICSRFPQLVKAERSNRRQARLPQGASHLSNPLGTAPAVRLQIEGCEVFALPGVPKEFRWCLSHHFIPWLKQYWGQKKTPYLLQKTLRVALVGESVIAERIEALNLPKTVRVGYQTLGSEHRIKVSATEEILLEETCLKIKHTADHNYLNDQDLSLSEQVIQVAGELGVTLGFAESCTGGLLSAALTKTPGASSVFWGSVISYANEIKQRNLSVPEAVLSEYGSVSEVCAKHMAENIRVLLNVDWAVSVTGIAGPGGATPTKSVGTVCFAWASQYGVDTDICYFRGDREEVQNKAVTYSLFHLLRRLQTVKCHE